MNKYSKYLITIALVALAVTTFVLFEVQDKYLTTDPIVNSMLGRTIYQLSIGALFIWLIYIMGDRQYLFLNRTTKKKLLWCLPCLITCLVNFPWFGVFSGNVTVSMSGYIALYAIHVISIALVEELVFRGVLLNLVFAYMRRTKLPYVFSVLISSAIFAAFHLFNLFIDANIEGVLLQMTYTFLIGCMFAVIQIKMGSVWYCVILHALFNFGGMFTQFGFAFGDPWDIVFWILTIVFGLLSAGHIIVTLINMERHKYDS
jgi:membrane protease YdiL (CAAX protease family)